MKKIKRQLGFIENKSEKDLKELQEYDLHELSLQDLPQDGSLEDLQTKVTDAGSPIPFR